MNTSKTLVPPIIPSSKEQIHVTLTTSPRGQQYVELRSHCLDSDNAEGVFKPTMKEIRIPVEQFVNFTESLNRANAELHLPTVPSQLYQFQDEAVPVNSTI
jgi:hypothetical protein